MVLIMNVELNFKLILWSFMFFLYSRFCYTLSIRFCCSSAHFKWKASTEMVSTIFCYLVWYDCLKCSFECAVALETQRIIYCFQISMFKEQKGCISKKKKISLFILSQNSTCVACLPILILSCWSSNLDFNFVLSIRICGNYTFKGLGTSSN